MHEYQDSHGPHLIVVPKSTLSNWMAELKRWAPGLSAVRFHGTKDEREEIARDVLCPGQHDEDRSWNVCVTTYEVCNMDRNVLNKFAWSYLIIDEAHRLKNEASTFSRTIRTFETRYRLLLTGTPLQNNLHELWALLNFLVPDVFASAEQFAAREQSGDRRVDHRLERHLRVVLGRRAVVARVGRRVFGG